MDRQWGGGRGDRHWSGVDGEEGISPVDGIGYGGPPGGVLLLGTSASSHKANLENIFVQRRLEDARTDAGSPTKWCACAGFGGMLGVYVE